MAGVDRRTIVGAGVLALAMPSVARAAGRREVEIAEFAFAPAALSAAAGDTVVWVNNDIVPHTASASDGSWDTGFIAPGERAEIVFEAAGTHDYYCLYHPHMTGRVVVSARQS